MILIDTFTWKQVEDQKEMKFSLHTWFLVKILSDLSVATERQCHNETGRCYWLGAGSKTWDALRTTCQLQGGDLAVMETEELHNFASNLFTARYLDIGILIKYRFPFLCTNSVRKMVPNTEVEWMMFHRRIVTHKMASTDNFSSISNNRVFGFQSYTHKHTMLFCS